MARSKARSSSLEPTGSVLDDGIVYPGLHARVPGRHRQRQQPILNHRPIGHGRRRRNSYSESRSCSPASVSAATSANASVGASTPVYGEPNADTNTSIGDGYGTGKGAGRQHSMTFESTPTHFATVSITANSVMAVSQNPPNTDNQPSAYASTPPMGEGTPLPGYSASPGQGQAPVNSMESSIAPSNTDPVMRLKRPRLIRFSPY